MNELALEEGRRVHRVLDEQRAVLAADVAYFRESFRDRERAGETCCAVSRGVEARDVKYGRDDGDPLAGLSDELADRAV